MHTTTTPHPITPEPQKHDHSIDYVKCVLILLMVAFHLAYIGDTHPWAKQLVYTFHMPGFLLISGYLTNVDKPAKRFLHGMLWLLVPYLVMESGYVVMASLLPIREHIDHLTPQVVARHLLLHPLGPYWYLHTLVLCQAILYAVNRMPRLSAIARIMLCALAYYGLAHGAHVISLPCALYFLAGAAIRTSRHTYTDLFRPTWLALPVFVLLAMHEGNLDKASTGGMLIVYCATSLILLASRHTPAPLCRVLHFVGRNTLPVFLFSPIFTILCKVLLPHVMFDPSGTVYLLVSLPICVAGSLSIAWLMDLAGASRLMFGKQRIIR